jgi:hypothetical protein
MALNGVAQHQTYVCRDLYATKTRKKSAKHSELVVRCNEKQPVSSLKRDFYLRYYFTRHVKRNNQVPVIFIIFEIKLSHLSTSKVFIKPANELGQSLIILI